MSNYGSIHNASKVGQTIKSSSEETNESMQSRYSRGWLVALLHKSKFERFLEQKFGKSVLQRSDVKGLWIIQRSRIHKRSHKGKDES